MNALKKFKELGIEKTQAITYEIAMLGRGGLEVNDPAKKYSLKSMPGEFTGIQLLSYMFVGLQQMNPGMDTGIDLQKEYQMALDMLQKEQNEKA